MTNIVKDTIAKIKNIPTEEKLVEVLQENTVVVTFKKLDGDERVMTCTKNLLHIPEVNHPKGVKDGKPGTITVWDVNANGWRSFVYERVINVDYLE
jgi:predicted metallopeptidase